MVDEQKWQELIEEFRKSGLSQREFAQKHNVDLGKLQYRLYKHNPKKRHSPEREEKMPIRFVPVRVGAPAAAQQEKQAGGTGLIEVELSSGILIRFPVETDCLYLGELITTLSV